jgi:dTDP-glucose 4,6-dehydratase
MSKRYLVTGGAGFIGSAVVRKLIQNTEHEVLVVDKLTYAGNLESLASVSDHPRMAFEQADIADAERMREIFRRFRPDIVMNLAAETHVDRSIDGPAAFIQTNVVGAFVILTEALAYYRSLDSSAQSRFRFHHISTDEVFGSLGPEGLFTEDSQYRPNSPYSATKAASDHLVNAWVHTYGLPAVVSNCSNNYGPYQFPEKLIPLTIINGVKGLPLPVYGAGENVRDWLFVDDHADALLCIAETGRNGRSYNVGGSAERRNIDVVRLICKLLDAKCPDARIGKRENLITMVTDRPGHDQRYAIDSSRIQNELGWTPSETFEAGLAHTVQWYLDNQAWWENVLSGSYRGERLGISH